MKVKGFVFAILFLILSISIFGQDAKPTENWATFEGNKIRYYDIGDRKASGAIVFIHGWTCNADFWKDSLNAFSTYRVIALDLPGHGQSDKSKANYTMEYFARSIDAVMSQANVKKVVLVGHSMGTPVARQFYRLYPAKTLAIVGVDGAFISFFPKEAMEQFLAPLRTNYKENAPKFVDGMLAPINDESLKKFIRDSMMATPEHVAISAMEGMADEKIWIEDKVNVPVLALMAPSQFWPPDIKERYQKIAPNLDFQMWSGVSHFLQMEQPARFNGQVKAFIIKNKLL